MAGAYNSRNVMNVAVKMRTTPQTMLKKTISNVSVLHTHTHFGEVGQALLCIYQTILKETNLICCHKCSDLLKQILH